MASGVIFGNCPACDELVWEDDWIIVDDKFMHEGCRKAYIKSKHGMNEEQFLRICGAAELHKDIADIKQNLKDTTELYMSTLASLEERLSDIENANSKGALSGADVTERI